MPRMRFTIEQYAKHVTSQQQLGETDKRLFYRQAVNECYNTNCWQRDMHNRVLTFTKGYTETLDKKSPHYYISKDWCVPYKPLPKETADAKDK